MEPPPAPLTEQEQTAALSALAPSARAPTPRIRLGIGAAIVLFILALLAAVAITAFGGSGVDETVPLAGPESSTGPPATPDAAAGGVRIYVHVLGAVGSAGLYELAEGSRVIDVIAAAGGFTDDADPAGVNLARPLADGEQLRVPRVGEVPAPPPPQPGGASGALAGGAASGPVSLNSATLAELETLPRIGPALAQRILDWREANGGFATIEDLRNVTGIGQKTFDGLKDHVTP